MAEMVLLREQGDGGQNPDAKLCIPGDIFSRWYWVGFVVLCNRLSL